MRLQTLSSLLVCSLLSTTAFAHTALAQEVRLPETFGTVSGEIANESSIEYQFSLKKDAAITVNLDGNSGISESCNQKISIRLIDSLGSKQDEEYTYTVPASPEKYRLGVAAKAPTDGTHRVIIEREVINTNQDSCLAASFPFTLTTTHHTGHVAPNKQISAQSATYSDA
ncbi:MAG: hypothetical protein KDD60_11925, partial [Bdellovibrionales bacterium]|nr:hypothetical protein [Bdellovibrionales bacterium]